MKRKHRIILVIACIAIVTISSSYWVLTQTPLPTPIAVCDIVMDYVGANHPDASVFIMNFKWRGGEVTPGGFIEGETYRYQADNWIVIIQHFYIPNPRYDITVDFSSSARRVSDHITWTGRFVNGIIVETSYIHSNE
jgi:hypothetical protein